MERRDLNQNEELDTTLKREIHMARNIQMKLLNGEKPVLESGEISGVSLPARLIGGDYFDFYPLSNGKIRIIIGDVMGKGIPAAMLMILTRGAFRSAAESTKGPGETLTAMNNAMFKDLRTLRSFVTVFCADWNPETEMLTYANGGHCLPIVVQDHSKIKELPKISGVMLGGLPNQQYQEEKMKLNEKDLIFFYTDGIVEAQNHSGDMYKLERLQEVLLQNDHLTADHIEKNVIDSIMKFTEGMPQKDDITMVILKIGELKVEMGDFHSPILTP